MKFTKLAPAVFTALLFLSACSTTKVTQVDNYRSQYEPDRTKEIILHQSSNMVQTRMADIPDEINSKDAYDIQEVEIQDIESTVGSNITEREMGSKTGVTSRKTERKLDRRSGVLKRVLNKKPLLNTVVKKYEQNVNPTDNSAGMEELSTLVYILLVIIIIIILASLIKDILSINIIGLLALILAVLIVGLILGWW